MDGRRQTPPPAGPHGLPVTGRGKLKCAATLRVEGTEHAWSAGDAAAVPDLTADTEPTDGAEPPLCAPNAQHAVRQARSLADNLAAVGEGREPTPYRHSYAGSVASLGLHKGVAHVYGRKLKGYPAWFMHRAYHLSRVPTFNRKARVLAEWVLSGLFKREIVSLGSLEHPRAEFESAAGTVRAPTRTEGSTGTVGHTGHVTMGGPAPAKRDPEAVRSDRANTANHTRNRTT